MVCDATDIKLDGQVVTDYITARFALGSDTVYKFTVDDFIEADTLRFTYVSAEDVDIDGDYTAGIDPAIPDKVPAFISVVEGGNWEDASTWAAYDPDTETIGAPGAAGVPKGAIIYLDHTVNVTADNKVAFRTQLNATGKLVLGVITSYSIHYTKLYENSGDWDDHTNWTLDPAGAIYINPDASYPAEVEIDDNVVVASGHDFV